MKSIIDKRAKKKIWKIIVQLEAIKSELEHTMMTAECSAPCIKVTLNHFPRDISTLTLIGGNQLHVWMHACMSTWFNIVAAASTVDNSLRNSILDCSTRNRNGFNISTHNHHRKCRVVIFVNNENIWSKQKPTKCVDRQRREWARMMIWYDEEWRRTVEGSFIKLSVRMKCVRDFSDTYWDGRDERRRRRGRNQKVELK